MTEFLSNLIIPLNLCLTLVAIGAVLVIVRLRRTGVVVILVGAVWLVAWSLPITSVWLG